MEDLLLTENEVLEQSRNAVRTLSEGLLKTKAYYNALAANAVMYYLREKGLLQKNIVNMHDCSKMLAEFEIADIQLPNLYIDVRAVFDEEEIFIPKKHFENKLLPDIYLIVKFDDDLKNAKILGIVEPSKINKQNQNEEYYFVNKSALTEVSKLFELISSSPVKNQYMISEDAEATIEKFIMLYMDHDIDDVKLEKLIDYLKNSAIAREKLVEFENFERLSYKALQEFKNLDIEDNDFSRYIKTLVTTDEFAQFDDKTDDLSELFGAEESSSASGLFIDELAEMPLEDANEVQESVADEITTEEESEQASSESDENSEEVVSNSLEVFENTEEIDISNEAQVSEENTEDVIDASVLDEFEAFESTDEFDVSEENLPVQVGDSDVELETENESESISEMVSEEILVNNDDSVVEPLELDIEPETIIAETKSEELSQESVDETATLADAIVTDEDIANISEKMEEPIAGEDLELQVEGLEDIGGELESEDIVLADENLDLTLDATEIVSDDLVEEVKPEEPKELDVAEALELNEIPLDSDTVIGLSEGVMDIKPSEEDDVKTEDIEVEDVINAENLDEISFDAESLNTDDISDEMSDSQKDSGVAEINEMVTDEDVDNAIMQAQVAEENEFSSSDEKHTEELNSDLDVLIGSEVSNDADNLNLDELLSMENDLSSTEEDTKHDFSDVDDFETDSEDSVSDAESAIDFTQVAEGSFNEEEETSDEDVSDFAFAIDSKPQSDPKKILIPVAALVTILGLAGAGVWYFLSHGKSNSVSMDIDKVGVGNAGAELDFSDGSASDTNLPLDTDIKLDANKNKSVSEQKAPTKTEGNKGAATLDTQVPAATEVANTKPEELTIQKIKKDFSQPNTYLSVSKIVWDVPEYLTYNDDFNNYLQTLGSTLKLNLSSDLLLISEDTVFNKVKVKIELMDSGKKYSAEIVDGCGAQVVDDLVLQSVKNTLNLLKPPVNSLETADEELFITIYL